MTARFARAVEIGYNARFVILSGMLTARHAESRRYAISATCFSVTLVKLPRSAMVARRNFALTVIALHIAVFVTRHSATTAVGLGIAMIVTRHSVTTVDESYIALAAPKHSVPNVVLLEIVEFVASFSVTTVVMSNIALVVVGQSVTSVVFSKFAIVVRSHSVTTVVISNIAIVVMSISAPIAARTLTAKFVCAKRTSNLENIWSQASQIQTFTLCEISSVEAGRRQVR